MQIKSAQPPGKHYGIYKEPDGSATIELATVTAYEPSEELPFTIENYTLRGVPWHDGLEINVREHFEAYIAAGAAVERERTVIQAAIIELAERFKKGELL